MLVENSREETLKAFLDGNKGTMAAIRQEDGSMLLAHITSLLPVDAVYFINVDLEDDKKKPKPKEAKDIIEPYVMQGLSDSEIAKKTGIKYGTVWAAAKKIREGMEETKGKNADRHLCKTCKYRAAAYIQNGSGIKCEYALKSGTKRSRGCDVEDCDKYEKGAPVKVKEET